MKIKLALKVSSLACSVLDEVLCVLSHESILHDVILIELAISLGLEEGAISVLLDSLVALLLESMIVNEIINGALADYRILSILLASSEGALHVFLVHVLKMEINWVSNIELNNPELTIGVRLDGMAAVGAMAYLKSTPW